MPKVHNTRKQRAELLLKRLEEGPAFGFSLRSWSFNPKEAKRRYKLWAETWIIPEVKALIKELNDK